MDLARRSDGFNEKSILGGWAVSFFIKFWKFIRVRKKFWLLPILLMIAVFSVLIGLSQGSAVSPFNYTIF